MTANFNHAGVSACNSVDLMQSCARLEISS
jgi:hypothetical protein